MVSPAPGPSLGKGDQGTAPIDALGTVDLHSQLQLYLAGRRNKFFTIITGGHAGAGESGHRRRPVAGPSAPTLAYLTGRRCLLMPCAARTIDALSPRPAGAGRGRRCGVSSNTGRRLFMHFMLETLITADLWGVDAFDQPAVEDGKMRVRAYLGVAE